MATLQNIRSKGPLLIIVVGVALFAFIAGDAWKVLQPHQSQDAGEINGQAISAQEYRTLLDEYIEVVKFSNGLSSLTDEQNNQIQDEFWNTYVNNKLIEKEAEKLGLTVPASEVQAIIAAGQHPMLRSTPFFNQQTGMFDNDMLKKFLVDYSKLDPKAIPDYYQGMFRLWSFIEKTLRQNRLAAKYEALISKSIMSNPIQAQASFDGRVNQSDLLLAAIPYSSIPDSTIRVKVSEVKEIYNKRKEEFRQDAETRDIRYIDVQITPSAEDRDMLHQDVMDYTTQLEAGDGEYTSLVRASGSEYPYVDLYYRREAYPADIIARLDSAAIGETYGPYYNAADNTFNSFKKLSRVMAADSIEFRQIQIQNVDLLRTRTLADSVYNALRTGADFTELAARYGQPGTSIWISSRDYEGAQMDNDGVKLISTLNNLGVNEMANVETGIANIIVQVTGKKNMTEKYKTAVIKRTVNISKDTYNRAYNDFSQFVAANSTLDKLVENAEDAGYRVYPRNDLRSSEHGIGGIRRTKEAIRWVFSAKPGEVSGLYEAGDNDRLLVVALENIHKEGYRSLEDVQNQLRADVVRDKKAAIIMDNMKTANATTFDQYKSMNDAVSDSVKHVTFNAPAYVSVLRSSEPSVGAYASVAQPNQLSGPIKGNNGVFVLQVYNQDKLDETYSAEDEKTNIQATTARLASRYLADLYRKANVKDNRYLFF